MVIALFPAAIVAALFALLFLLAWEQWRNVIVNSLEINLPVIGNVIASGVSFVLDSAYATLVYWLDGAVNPIAGFILAPVATVENIVAGIQSAIANSYNISWQIINQRLPWLQQTIAGSVANDLATLESNVLGYVNSADAALHATDVYLSGDIDQAYARAVTYTQQVGAAVDSDAHQLAAASAASISALATQVEQAAAADLNTALNFTRQAYDETISYTTQTAATIEAQLGNAISDLQGFAETTATTAVAAGVTDIDNAITGALSGIWTDVDGAITDVIGVIGTGDAAIRDALGRIDWSIPANLAAVASLAGVTSLTLARYLRDCGIPNCQNLSQLGKDLQALFGVVEDASFVTLLVELIHHPSDAATTVDNVFGDTIRTGTSLAKSLLSV